MSLTSIMLMGFLASLGHCTFMCGGFSLALGRIHSSFFHLLFYHFARIMSYAFLGGLFGTLGHFIFAFGKASCILLFISGLFMVLFGLALLVRGTILSKLEGFFTLPWIKSLYKSAFKLKGFKAVFILGLLNGLLPCGVVYTFLALSLACKSTQEGILIMLCFGISTLPIMLFFSGLSFYIKKLRLEFFSVIAYIMIIIYGIYLSYLGFKCFV